MSDEGSILNFMALVNESEKEAETLQVPFNLTQQNQKVIFQKVRAKNFRSVGNDWMEVDFLKAKSTLVVSEDNGSGKSTLTIWAPYFALFDKPYNPKELKAALVNSATNKDAMVELFFNTKGKNWLVRRGYKPAVFDLMFQDPNGEWIKEQCPAAMKDQQKHLESIIGFDAKIAENVMILGADKFTPFIEMDTPSRRHVVEQIWDLAVFPVMLKVAKEDLAVLVRHQDELSHSIDKSIQNVKHSEELLEQIESKREFTKNLEERVEALKSHLTSIDAEKTALSSDHKEREETLNTEIRDLGLKIKEINVEISKTFDVKLIEVNDELEASKVEGEKEIETACVAMNDELRALTTKLQSQEEEEEAALKVVTTEGSKRFNELNELLKGAEEAAEEAASKIVTDRATWKFEGDGDIEDVSERIEKMSSIVNEFTQRISSAEREVDGAYAAIGAIKLGMSGLEAKRESKLKQREDILKQIGDFEHMGTCPTCSQAIGVEAVEGFKKTLDVKLAALSVDDEDRSIEELKSEITRYTEIQRGSSDTITAIRTQLDESSKGLSELKEKLVGLQDQKSREFSEWESTTQSMVAVMKADFTRDVKTQISELVSHTKVAQAELKTHWEEVKRGTRSLIDNHETLISKTRAEAQVEVNKKISVFESKLRNIQSDFKAEVSTQTANLQTELDTRTNMLVDAARSFTQNMGRLITEMKSVQDAILKDQSELEQLSSSITTEAQHVTETMTLLKSELERFNATFQSNDGRITVYKNLTVELGDKAAKAEIIKAYMPFLNHKVNEYLDALNLHVGFKMDENFGIEFTAPDRKRQTTWSLSKGQAMRMNLAMLFALRDVANLKASVSTNLLIMDETLEALSERGVQEIMEMFSYRFKDVNMFVVTQRKAEFSEYFTDVINYGLRGGFTVQLD